MCDTRALQWIAVKCNEWLPLGWTVGKTLLRILCYVGMLRKGNSGEYLLDGRGRSALADTSFPCGRRPCDK